MKSRKFSINQKIQHLISWNQQKLIIEKLSSERNFRDNWLIFKAIWKYNVNRHNIPLEVICKRFNYQLVLNQKNPDFLMSFIFKYEADILNRQEKIAICQHAISNFNNNLHQVKQFDQGLTIAHL